MIISVAIMAHHSREERANELKESLLHQGFCHVDLCIDRSEVPSRKNEWVNGAKSLASHCRSEWHIVIQDDAIISNNFRKNVVTAIKNIPSRSIISLYTGRVRPFSTLVQNAVDEAERTGANWLLSSTLHWGVGIVIPTNYIDTLLEFTRDRNEEYDRRIGEYFFAGNAPVYYTYPSLVDHDDSLGSILGNGYNRLPRVAHRYEPGFIEHWNSKVIKMYGF